MSKWQEIRIKEFANVVAGGTPSTTNDEYWNGSIGWITPADLSNYKFRYISTGERNITELGLHKSAACLLPKNTVLLSSRAPIGYVAIAETELATNQGFKNLVCDKNIVDYRFIYYWLSLNTEVLKSFASGATFPELSASNIKRIKAVLPDLPTQKRIADILSAYDDLIENNNRRIALLERAAQEIYKEWFVRFRFPGYEAAKFENGLPEGWAIKKIGDIARIKSGYAFKSEWWTDEGVPVIKIKDIQNNTIDFGDLSRVSEENALLAKQFFVTEGDLLIAMTGATIGKLALVPFSSEKLVVNQRVGKFFLGDNPIATVPFLYCTLQQNWIQEMIIMIASSNAAQPNISPFDIEKIKVVYSEKIVDAFNERASKFINQILLLQKRNQNLAKQRDLLLPRLMSGKLEV